MRRLETYEKEIQSRAGGAAGVLEPHQERRALCRTSGKGFAIGLGLLQAPAANGVERALVRWLRIDHQPALGHAGIGGRQGLIAGVLIEAGHRLRLGLPQHRAPP
jgi:hypothetical protein